jgi:hypothetical protein
MSGTRSSIDAAEPAHVVRAVVQLRSYIEVATAFVIFDPAAIRPLLQRRDDIAAALDDAAHAGNVLLVRNEATDAANGTEAVFRIQMAHNAPDESKDRSRIALDGAILNVPSGRLFVNAAASSFLRAPRSWNGDAADYEPYRPYAGESTTIATGAYSIRVWSVDWEPADRRHGVEASIPRELLQRHRRYSWLLPVGCVLTGAAFCASVGLVVYFALHRQWVNAGWTLTTLPLVWLLLRTLFRIPGSENYEEAARAVRDAENMFPHAIIEMTPIDVAAASRLHAPCKCGWVFVK